MAVRPVYEISENPPFFRKRDVEFTFYSGFSLTQKQRCVESLHKSYNMLEPDKRTLEISRASSEKLGTDLSAFNLTITPKNGQSCTVESAFQGAKVFENGGPYSDLIYKSSKEAKTDARIRESGNIIAFRVWDMDFPNEPKTFFYNWLYITALNFHPELHKELSEYGAFTDIMFNPAKSLNCQAEAAAIFVSLSRSGKLQDAVKNKDSFLKVVYDGQA